MKLSTSLLFFACVAFSACLGASAASEDEPIPDFGPDGPVGYAASEDEPIPDFGPDGPVGYKRPNVSAENVNKRSGHNQANGVGRAIFYARAALRQLDLDADQQQAIKNAFDQFAEEGEKLRAEMTCVQDTIRTARMSDGNESVVKNARQSMAELSLKGKTLQAQLRQSISKVLSEEQF